MKKTQFDTLVIHDFEAETFHLPIHSHTYYEIVYINKGSGIHLLNKSKVSYGKGDLFLICPDDEHSFEIKTSTHFTFIKFTDSYFSGYKMSFQEDMIVSSPEEIMRNKLLKEVRLKMDAPYAGILKDVVKNIVAYGTGDLASSAIVYYLILAIFGIVKETAARLDIRIDKGQPDKEELISYIHQHIYDPSLIRIKSIATHFNIAPTYFSDYFRRKFEINYRDYVNEYRIKLIENRIMVSMLTMKQIAAEFGFNDESHLSHFFKTMKGMSPMQFKNGLF